MNNHREMPNSWKNKHWTINEQPKKNAQITGTCQIHGKTNIEQSMKNQRKMPKSQENAKFMEKQTLNNQWKTKEKLEKKKNSQIHWFIIWENHQSAILCDKLARSEQKAIFWLMQQHLVLWGGEQEYERRWREFMQMQECTLVPKKRHFTRKSQLTISLFCMSIPHRHCLFSISKL